MQIVGDQLQGVAAILRLLVRAFDFGACPAVIDKDRHETGKNDQADGNGYHQLDNRVAELLRLRAAGPAADQKHDVVPTVTVAAITRRFASLAPKDPAPQASVGLWVGFRPCHATET